jgi:hypothetical protein
MPTERIEIRLPDGAGIVYMDIEIPPEVEEGVRIRHYMVWLEYLQELITDPQIPTTGPWATIGALFMSNEFLNWIEEKEREVNAANNFWVNKVYLLFPKPEAIFAKVDERVERLIG